MLELQKETEPRSRNKRSRWPLMLRESNKNFSAKEISRRKSRAKRLEKLFLSLNQLVVSSFHRLTLLSKAKKQTTTSSMLPVSEMVNPATNLPPLMVKMELAPGFCSSATLSSLDQENMSEGDEIQQLEMAFSAESELTAKNNIGDDDIESRSGGSEKAVECGSTGGDQVPNQKPRKKRYHRHTQHQIQRMETFFLECPHPNDKQRKKLSRELGLEPLQIKFWFQNKRTQVKSHIERVENNQLRTENEQLRSENMRYKQAMSHISCPSCGGPALGEMSFEEHHLRVENARLREEINRITAMAGRHLGKPPLPIIFPPSTLPSRRGSSLIVDAGAMGGQQGEAAGWRVVWEEQYSQVDKGKVVEVAVAAMEELKKMAEAEKGASLWIPGMADESSEILNMEKYIQMFPGKGVLGGPTPPGLTPEGSRATAHLHFISHINLVEILMDVKQWSAAFHNIVSKALTLEVLSTGIAGKYNGALQVMAAEFRVPTPMVPTRESYFVRYSKQHSDGTWAVVDVSLDSLHPGSVIRSRRRPSGCLIQPLPNGFSKVIWIEHVEADTHAVHNLYKPLIDSGLAFGAHRWVATLHRQCERLATVMANNTPITGEFGGITSRDGRAKMLKLAERMVINYCATSSASTPQNWSSFPGYTTQNVRFMIGKSIDDPGKPPGIVLSATTSIWLPISPKRVFDFLRDENSRNKWDILSAAGVVEGVTHIASGRKPGNRVSILRVIADKATPSSMLIVQESVTDSTGSYVIYAPVDLVAMNAVLAGGNPDCVALLPSGFAILPDKARQPMEVEGGESGVGSLLTVAFQILVDSVPTAKFSLSSVATVNTLLARTVEKIKAALECE